MRVLLATLVAFVTVGGCGGGGNAGGEAPAAPAAEAAGGRDDGEIMALDDVKASQSGSVWQEVANTSITVTYDRPVARGRELFGGIVPFGEIWNPGANDATAIARQPRRDPQRQRAARPASYSLWAIPDPNRWTLIFSREADVYHTPYPGEEHDALRLMVSPRLGEHMETLAFYFAEVEKKDAELRLHWGDTYIPAEHHRALRSPPRRLRRAGISRRRLPWRPPGARGVCSAEPPMGVLRGGADSRRDRQARARAQTSMAHGFGRRDFLRYGALATVGPGAWPRRLGRTPADTGRHRRGLASTNCGRRCGTAA